MYSIECIFSVLMKLALFSIFSRLFASFTEERKLSKLTKCRSEIASAQFSSNLGMPGCPEYYLLELNKLRQKLVGSLHPRLDHDFNRLVSIHFPESWVFILIVRYHVWWLLLTIIGDSQMFKVSWQWTVVLESQQLPPTCLVIRL